VVENQQWLVNVSVEKSYPVQLRSRLLPHRVALERHTGRHTDADFFIRVDWLDAERERQALDSHHLRVVLGREDEGFNTPR
jgi:hypothetical protein